MGKKLGPRRLQKNTDGPMVGPRGGKEVQRITIGKGRYVQTYTTCGNRCSRCTPGGRNYDPDRPGHGPYWYRVVENSKGNTIRRYCGRDLEAYLAEKRADAAGAVGVQGEVSE